MHIYSKYKKSKALLCNPGSVGQLRDHNPRAAYAIFEPDGKIELKRVSYDIERIVYEMKKNSLGNWIANVLYSGKRIGE
jgi:predicted phosphodiesterase